MEVHIDIHFFFFVYYHIKIMYANMSAENVLKFTNSFLFLAQIRGVCTVCFAVFFSPRPKMLKLAGSRVRHFSSCGKESELMSTVEDCTVKKWGHVTPG